FGIKGSLTPALIVRLLFFFACSTPFGIKGSLTCASRFIDSHNSVLNAFRHQRFSHQSVRPMSVIECRCSTPFGIKGSLTSEASQLHFAKTCAQRLSASKVLSPFYARCSNKNNLVLNAFRHQRFSHSTMRDRKPNHLRRGAQRLSASKVLSLR